MLGAYLCCMLRTRVYAGPIANLTDGRYFASYGVQWLGFQLDPLAPDAIEPDKAAEIKNWLYGVRFVAEFAGHIDADDVAQRAEFVQPDAALFPLEAIELAGTLPDTPLVVQCPADAPDFALQNLPPRTEAVLLNLRGLSAEAQDEALARVQVFMQDINPDVALLADLELDAKALPGWLDRHAGIGLRLQGGAEQQVGIKLFEALDAYMEVLEVED